MSSILWPILVIALGLFLFLRNPDSKGLKESVEEVFPPGKKLLRSGTDKRVAGVCGGIGAYFGIDSNIIRIFWVMATLGSFGLGVLAYLILAIYLDELN
ncbi:MAG: PspC domain-containing protein [Candidatus Marinimicrobia bacterium]|nr:PspC domain-containing protein [Candidatus Neomarinimicrobiota bacterium]